jgi:hypothetical protein
MRRILFLTLFALLAAVPFGVGSPTTGTVSDYFDVGATAWTTTKTFAAGERACVMAIGDHKETVNLEVNIYQKDTLIASDKTGNTLVGDFVGVIWYPPRDGEYRIEVRTSGTRTNKCYIAIK